MRIARLSAMLVVATTIACGGDDSTGPSDDDDDNDTGPISTLTVSVNGSVLTAGIISGAWSGGQFALSGIFGTGSATRSLNISANNFPGPGTYQLGLGNPSTAIATWIDGTTGSYSTLATGASGTITLTIAQPGHIKGTFSLTVKTVASGSSPVLTVNITNGEFEVKLQ
jgi:hypothetical protein